MKSGVIHNVYEKARTGSNLISSGKSERSIKGLDDVTLVPAQVSRLVFDGYREQVNTKVLLSKREIEKNIELEMPVIISGMSFGALSKEMKVAISMAAEKAGIAVNTGEGGLIPEQRDSCSKIIFQMLSGRYGVNREVLTHVEAIEIMLGQGAKPGMGGHLQAAKITEEIARTRTIPMGKDLRSPSRHLDILGPDDLSIKVEELRELTDYKVPITVKIAAGRVKDDVKLIAKTGVDAIVIDAFGAGTGAAPEIIQNNVGIPLLAALKMAREAIKEIGMENKMTLIASGGIFDGADVVKAIALGADIVALGSSILYAAGCTCCHQCYTGRCEEGICTQDEVLRKRFDVEKAALSIANYLLAIKKEIRLVLASLGKTDIRSLEVEDVRALDIETKQIAGIGLIGEN